MNQLQYIKIQKLIEELKNKDHKERIKFIKTILGKKKIHSEIINNVLTHLLADTHYNVRFEAVKAFGEIGSKKDALKIIPLLKDKKYEVRYVAAEVLGLLNNRNAAPFLIRVLNDKDEVVRINAAESLGILKYKEAIKPLISLLKDQDELVRGYAAEALGEIRDKKVKATLKNILKTEKRNATKLRIFKALYKLGDKSKLEDIMHLLNAKSYKVRCATANILGEIINNKSHDEIVMRLKQRLEKEKTIAVQSTIKNIIRKNDGVRLNLPQFNGHFGELGSSGDSILN